MREKFLSVKLKIKFDQTKESRKLKNVLNEFNSDEIPGHKFEDLDSVLEVRVGVINY